MGELRRAPHRDHGRAGKVRGCEDRFHIAYIGVLGRPEKSEILIVVFPRTRRRAIVELSG
jgi:hypothetical protein